MSSSDPISAFLDRLKTPQTGSPVPVTISRSVGGDTRNSSARNSSDVKKGSRASSKSRHSRVSKKKTKGASVGTSFDDESVEKSQLSGDEEDSVDTSKESDGESSKKSKRSVPKSVWIAKSPKKEVSIAESRPTQKVWKYEIGILPQKP